MPYIENIYEFQARMACPFVVRKQGGLLFENGAESDGNLSHQDPPHAPALRLNLQCEYWTVRAKRAETAFAVLKTQLQGGEATDERGRPVGLFRWDAEEFGPMPPEQEDEFGYLVGVASLRRLQQIVMQRRRKLQEVEKQIADLPENRQQCEAQELGQRLDAETASRQRDRLIEVNAITI